MICSSVGPPRTVDELLARYVLFHPLSRGALDQLRVAVGLFARYLERPARLDDLTPAAASGWIAWLADGRAAATVHGKRRMLLTLWRFAAEEGFCQPPRQVRRVRIPRAVPRAWTAEEVAAIARACRCHSPRYGAALAATVYVCWDANVRISAVAAARPRQFDPRRRMVLLTEPKTLAERAYPLSRATCAALARLPKDRDHLCGWTVGVKRLREEFDRVLALAGFEHDRRSKFHRIRRSKYTAVAVKFGLLAAAKHAGHADTSMARYYLDTRLVPVTRVVDQLKLR